MTKVLVNDIVKSGEFTWEVGDYFKHIDGEIYIVARVGLTTTLVCLNDGGYWGTCDKISGNREDLCMGEFTPISVVEISIS